MSDVKVLGYAVCGIDTGHGSVGIPTYRGSETLHPTQEIAQQELDEIEKKVRKFYGIVKVFRKKITIPPQPARTEWVTETELIY